MPYVSIRLYAGHPRERKDEIARRITDTLAEVCQGEAVWGVFGEVPPSDWYVPGTPGTPPRT